jgi:hypothetical protein
MLITLIEESHYHLNRGCYTAGVPRKATVGGGMGSLWCLAMNQGFVCGSMMAGFAYADIVVKGQIFNLP